jgi:hypothetical protein
MQAHRQMEAAVMVAQVRRRQLPAAASLMLEVVVVLYMTGLESLDQVVRAAAVRAAKL